MTYFVNTHYRNPLATLFMGLMLFGCQSHPLNHKNNEISNNVLVTDSQPFFTADNDSFIANFSTRNVPQSYQLEYQNNCLYLFDGVNRTVPIFPKNVAHFDKNNQILTYYGFHYPIGYVLDTLAVDLTPNEKNIFLNTTPHLLSPSCTPSQFTYLKSPPAGGYTP